MLFRNNHLPAHGLFSTRIDTVRVIILHEYLTAFALSAINKTLHINKSYVHLSDYNQFSLFNAHFTLSFQPLEIKPNQNLKQVQFYFRFKNAKKVSKIIHFRRFTF